MLRYLMPDEYHNSIKDIDFKSFYADGYDALLFDIDNTLVEEGAHLTKEVAEFIQQLKANHFKICLLSNNNEYRVRLFAEDLQIPYIAHAGKPSKKGYINAMNTLQSDETTTCMIGDQIFTDIYGANKLGIYTIRVNPISDKEPFLVKIKRIPEKIIMHYRKSSDKRKTAKV